MIDLNGYETYVSEKFRSREIDWFPIGLAENIPSGETSAELEDKLGELDQKICQIISLLNPKSLTSTVASSPNIA
jgi:hypothetical protein